MFTRALPILFAGLSLFAQGGPQGGPQGHGPLPFLMPLRALNLTEAQQASLRQILDAHKAAMDQKTAAAQAARKALGDALTQVATPDAQLKALHDTAAAAQFEVLKEGRAIFLEVDSLLAPEQRAKAQELKATLHRHLEGLRGMAFGH